MMRNIIVVLAILAAMPLVAQDLADFQSRDFANESHQMLGTGDRAGAIIAALKGLPAKPVQEDLERFSAAYDALLRAAVSRSIRLDLPVMSVFEFDSTGARLASAGLLPSRDGDQSRSGLALWDPRTGEKVANLLPIEALTSGAWGVQAPAFSPDGRFLAQMAPVEGVAVVFDAGTGAEIARLPGHASGTTPNSGGLAFSRDSSLLLTLGASPTVAQLWDTSTWQRVASAEFSQFTLLTPIDGGKDGVMQFVASDVVHSTPPPVELWKIDRGGASRVHEFPPEPSGLGSNWGRIPTDDEDRLFAMPNGNFDLLVFERETGAEVARLPAAIVGQSTGIVAPSGDGVLLLSSMNALPRRLAFDGSDVPLETVDKLAGIHGVFSLGGELMGGSPDILDYRGTDLPRGLELHQSIMSALPDEVKAEVNAEKVKLD